MQRNAKQSNAMQSKIKQSRAKQCKANQCKAMQSNAKQSTAKHCKTKYCKAALSNAMQSNAKHCKESETTQCIRDNSHKQTIEKRKTPNWGRVGIIRRPLRASSVWDAIQFFQSFQSRSTNQLVNPSHPDQPASSSNHAC